MTGQFFREGMWNFAKGDMGRRSRGTLVRRTGPRNQNAPSVNDHLPPWPLRSKLLLGLGHLPLFTFKTNSIIVAQIKPDGMKRMKRANPRGSPKRTVMTRVGQLTTNAAHRNAYSPTVGAGSVGTRRSGKPKMSHSKRAMPASVTRRLTTMNLVAFMWATTQYS